MMKERLKRPQPSVIAGIGIVLALVAGIVVFALLMSLLAVYIHTVYGWDTTFLQYVEYALLIVFGVWIVRRWLTEYEYDLIDDELLIDQVVGRREKNLLHVKLKDITAIGQGTPEGFKGRPQRLTYKRRRRGVIYAVYGGKCFYFSPSDKLLALIETRRAKR